MPFKINWQDIGLTIGSVLVLVGTVYGIYSVGYKNGKAYVQAEWNAYKVVQANELVRIKDEYAGREAISRTESARISDELQSSQEALAKAVADLNVERAARLRLSAERASIYERLSKAGPAEQERLAGYAARLDRSLEEGRSLVRELRATVELRESELRLLGEQIKTDRKLIGE